MKEPDHLLDLIRKHLQGEPLDSSEIEIFESWRTENEDVYEQYRKIWIKSVDLKLQKSVDVDEQWQNWKSQQDQPAKTKWYAVAAVVSLLVVATIALFQLDKPEIYSVGQNSQPKLFVLEDGSKVWLNQNSQLILEDGFNEKEREVRLVGEGYFEVQSNEEKPFIVQNEFSSITVLGTKFNAISNDSTNEVQLLEGKVEFSDQLDKSQTLLPGEEAFISKEGEIMKSSFADQNFLSWKTGLLRFENESFGAMVKALEKHYRVKINLANDQIGYCHVTITFDNATLDDALEELSFLLDLEYSINGKIVNIDGKGCDE